MAAALVAELAQLADRLDALGPLVESALIVFAAGLPNTDDETYEAALAATGTAALYDVLYRIKESVESLVDHRWAIDWTDWPAGEAGR